MDHIVITDEKRSYNMSRIKGKDTSIEVSLRKALWRNGIRYRKNFKALPGNPDIAITKHQIAIFCDGEFWHGKEWEVKKHRIKSNREYWIKKIENNMDRDKTVDQRLSGKGWTVIRFWGDDIKNDVMGCVEEVKDAIFQSQLDGFDNCWDGFVEQ